MKLRDRACRLSGRAALLLAVVSAGCGPGGGPERIRISGNVTFQGKPVPYGTITFEPDTSKGNSGPQGFAKIQDGKYDTNLAGAGPCPGAQSVLVEGYPELGNEQNKRIKTVFNYRVTLDLPRETTTHDFEVPASAIHKEAAADLNLPPP